MAKENNTLSLPPAPVWRRFAAILYDSFLVLSLLFLVGFINLAIQLRLYGQDQLRQMTENGDSLGGPFFYTTILLTVFSFFAFFWTRRGQTLGMQVWRVRVLNDDGSKISMKQSFLRFITAIPALFLFGLGVIWSLWDSKKLSWQDRLSGSRTVFLAK